MAKFQTSNVLAELQNLNFESEHASGSIKATIQDPQATYAICFRAMTGDGVVVRFLSGRVIEVDALTVQSIGDIRRSLKRTNNIVAKLVLRGRELRDDEQISSLGLLPDESLTGLEMRPKKAPASQPLQKPSGPAAAAPADPRASNNATLFTNPPVGDLAEDRRRSGDQATTSAAAAAAAGAAAGGGAAPASAGEGPSTHPARKGRKAAAPGAGKEAAGVREPSRKRRKAPGAARGGGDQGTNGGQGQAPQLPGHPPRQFNDSSSSSDIEVEGEGGGGPARKDAALSLAALDAFGRPLPTRLALLADKLPLPPSLKPTLDHFEALSAVCGFLARQRVQPTWLNTRAAVHDALGGREPTVSDIETLASLATHLVVLREPYRVEKSAVAAGDEARVEPAAAPPIDLAKAGGFIPEAPAAGGAGKAGAAFFGSNWAADSGGAPIVHSWQEEVMALSGSGSDPGPGFEVSFLIELVDPGVRPPSVATREQAAGEAAAAAGAGMQGIGGTRGGGSRAADLPTERAAQNAVKRRSRAFRHSVATVLGRLVEEWSAGDWRPQEEPEKPPAVPVPDTADCCAAAPFQGPQEDGTGGGVAIDVDPLPAPRESTPPPPDPQADKSQREASFGACLSRSAWPPGFPLDRVALSDVVAAAERMTEAQLGLIEAQANALLGKGDGAAAAAAAGAAGADWAGGARDGSPVRAAAAARGGAGGHISAALRGVRSPNRAPRPLVAARHAEPCVSTEALGTEAFFKHLQDLPWYKGQAVHVRKVAARPSAKRAPEAQVHPAAQAALMATRGLPFSELFSHQAAALDALLLRRRHVVVATPTASGKSLCYQLPVIDAIARDPTATALYLFPTKALAQDQLRATKELLAAAFADGPHVPSVAVYDGDTPMPDRTAIRDAAQIIITNPDMLHVSILPVHRGFQRLLSGLRYVVIDEGHAYRGAFGSHVSLVMRRLRRVCEREYGASPQFVVTSATIANAREHVAMLTGLEEDSIELVEEDGSPSGEKTWVLWNPPLSPGQVGAGTVGDGARGGPPAMSRTEARSRTREIRTGAAEARKEAIRMANQARVSPALLGKSSEGDWKQDVALALVKPQLQRSSAGNSPLSGAAPLALPPAAAAAAAAAAAPLAKPAPAGPPRPVIRRKGLPVPDPEVPDLPPRELQRRDGEIQARLPGPEYLRQYGRPDPRAPPAAGDNQGPGLDPDAGPRQPPAAAADPAALDPALQRRNSPIVEISMLLCECIRHGLRTIAFVKTRKLCELVVGYVRETLRATHPALRDSIAVYRAGYSASDRRDIEGALFGGRLRAVAATNALELGVDVGELDCTLHLGFPGTVASLWQQAGRAGRRGQTSLAVYVAWDGPLDQYFLGEPERLFGRPIEGCSIDPSNPQLLALHASCAAYELPLSVQQDAAYLGMGAHAAAMHMAELAGNGAAAAAGGNVPAGAVGVVPAVSPAAVASLASAVAKLRSARLVAPDPSNGGVRGGYLRYSGAVSSPASAFSLRAIDPIKYQVVESGSGTVLEEIEEGKAFYAIYDGAAYLYQGRSYLCTSLDLRQRVAVVRRADLKYFTSVRDFTDVHVFGGSLAYPAPQATRAPPPQAAAAAAAAPPLLIKEEDGPEEAEAEAAARPVQRQEAVYAECIVTTRFLGFHRIWHGSNKVFDTVDLFLPDVQYSTRAAYCRVPHSVRHELAALGLPYRDAVHAASHAVLSALPLHVMCDAADVACECDSPDATRYRPERVLLYDKHPGGVGLAARAAPRFSSLVAAALEMVERCPCRSATGCPGCVQHPACPEYNAVLHKGGGKLVLQRLMESLGAAG